MNKNKKYALISTFNKKGLLEMCQIFKKYNIEIISTGSTGNFIKKHNYKCSMISELTKFKEILDGRVKTLHPKIHSSLLYDRKNNKHIKSFKNLNFPSIDYVIVNLYPFEQTINKTKNINDCIEMIDIGGPTMLRSAAKNFNSITSISDINNYSSFIKNLNDNNGVTTLNFRKKMAQKTFETTFKYDQTIFNWFTKTTTSKQLRYGENPHQKAKIYKNYNSKTISDYQIHGKEMGYNNIIDIDSGIDCLNEFNEPTCIIIKHNNPCGVASKKTIKNAFKKALECDEISAFGGIVVLNRTVNKTLAKEIYAKFFEVIAAPNFDSVALEILKERENLILIKSPKSIKKNTNEIKSIVGGYISQQKNNIKIKNNHLKNMSNINISKILFEDLLFALKICKHVKSNAIVLAKNKQTLGIGAGQMSRIDSTKLALKKIKNKNNGFVAASDAFFPFTDSLKKLIQNNCLAVVQPSGSIKDKKIINYAKKKKLPLYFSKFRLFKH